MEDTPVWSHSLEGRGAPLEAADVHEFVRRHLLAHDLPHLVDDVTLVVGELVGRATSGPAIDVTVLLRRTGSSVDARVTRTAVAATGGRLRPGADDPGLTVVEALSGSWGLAGGAGDPSSVWAHFASEHDGAGSRVSSTLRQDVVTRTFVMLADTLVDDFDVAALLDRLVRSCVHVFGVAGAGLVLVDRRGKLRLAASTDDQVRAVELVGLRAAEGGPGGHTSRHGTTVDVDLAGDHAWPRLAERALAAGFGAAHAVPLRLRDETLGALTLFSAPGAPLSHRDQRLARAFADVATIGLLQQRSIQRSTVLAAQLQSALKSRVVIEQAKGVLAEHGGIDMDTAFAALRQFARDHQLKLGALAQAVVRREHSPEAIVTALTGRPPPT